jgi:hypothetical protein
MMFAFSCYVSLVVFRSGWAAGAAALQSPVEDSFAAINTTPAPA